MKRRTKLAIASALLAVMAVPAYADKDMSDEKGGPKAERAERQHDRESGGHGRGSKAMKGGHGIRGGHGMKGGYGRIMTFDTDGDGRVTQAEVDAFRGGRLAKFDSDGNGSLNLSEYQALWLAAMRERMVDRFQDLDADGNAVVTAEEFKRPFANLVRHMDRNGDGVLSRERGKKAERKQ